MNRRAIDARPRRARRARTGQEGFTLIEVLIAVVVLVFGLIAVTNLMVVAGTSNRVAGDSTAAANVAQQQLDQLRAMDLATLMGYAGLGDQQFTQNVPGVGDIAVTWRVENAGVPVGVYTAAFITVEAESVNPIARARSRAAYTLWRTCTDIRPGFGC